MGPSGSGYSPSSADKAGRDTKQRSSHSSLFALQAASLGSNTAMAGSEQRLSSKGGKLSDMLVDFVEQCSLGNPPVSCAVSRHKALVLCIVSRCLCATRG